MSKDKEIEELCDSYIYSTCLGIVQKFIIVRGAFKGKELTEQRNKTFRKTN